MTIGEAVNASGDYCCASSSATADSGLSVGRASDGSDSHNDNDNGGRLARLAAATATRDAASLSFGGGGRQVAGRGGAGQGVRAPPPPPPSPFPPPRLPQLSPFSVPSRGSEASVEVTINGNALFLDDRLHPATRAGSSSSSSAGGGEGGRREAREEETASFNSQPPQQHQQQQRRDWASILSIGEQQRLGIARVLYHRPALAFLDESTSAVTEAAEKEAYRLMREAGITLVTVGHRSSLKALHERVLSLEGAPNGRWEILEDS